MRTQYYTEVSFIPTKAWPLTQAKKELNKIVKRRPSDLDQDYDKEVAVTYEFKSLPALRKAVGRLRESGLKLRIYTCIEQIDGDTEDRHPIKELSSAKANCFQRSVDRYERHR